MNEFYTINHILVLISKLTKLILILIDYDQSMMLKVQIFEDKITKCISHKLVELPFLHRNGINIEIPLNHVKVKVLRLIINLDLKVVSSIHFFKWYWETKFLAR